MTKPELIGSSKSTYTRVVRMVCEEKGIEYKRAGSGNLNRAISGVSA